uniref:TFIIH p62 subunit N-terminal domain-containing protein n=1 Tax=Nothoprocta perdicaria TaxID=30464 RepID=A0A8C6ZZ34_NOTPE
MATSSEEVLLIVKKVRQKKQDGALYLMAERIAWAPEGKDRFTVSHMYADIKCKQRAFRACFSVQCFSGCLNATQGLFAVKQLGSCRGFGAALACSVQQ